MSLEFVTTLPKTPRPATPPPGDVQAWQPLLVTVPHADFPMLGAVQAGFPSPAADYFEERINLQTELIKHPHATFFMRSQGESMIGAFIPPEAILVIDRLEKAVHGSIVVAVLDGEYTVKRLHIQGTKKQLLPENDAYPPIDINEFTRCEIWGVVIHIIINAKTV